MGTERENSFSRKPLEVVADAMAQSGDGSYKNQMAKAEFFLRQTQAQIEAAVAAKDTAEYTKKYTRYMFWSVVVLAASTLGNFLIEIIKWAFFGA